MARFRVYRYAEGRSLLLDVQANLMSQLSTCVVVPLLPTDGAPLPAKGLNPVFRLADEDYVMATQFIASVPRAVLREEVHDLEDQAAVVVSALDVLFQGV